MIQTTNEVCQSNIVHIEVINKIFSSLVIFPAFVIKLFVLSGMRRGL